jgi:hypothetical protein
MKTCIVLLALAVGFAATASYGQGPQHRTTKTAAIAARAGTPHHGTTKAVPNPALASSATLAGSRRGSLGGPVNKGASINGTGMRPKTSSR